jgi:signal peptidase II
MTTPETEPAVAAVPTPTKSWFGFRHSVMVIVLFYALDQLTKWLVVQNIEPGEWKTIVPNFFDLVYLTNTGAAFSVLSNNNTFFIALSLVVLVALIFFYRRGSFRGALLGVGVSLLIAGILGNLTDRILHQHVIDFLLFDLHVKFANPWPAFNVADSCICVAAGLFVIASFREQKPE